MPHHGKSKLLIVDDLPDNLMALEAILAHEARDIFRAQSGEEALALLLKHDFALAIIDVQMPGMNGFELADLMRGTGRTRSIPIIFVSAGGAELNYPFRGYVSGAIDFLYKPLDTVAVQSKVQILVELYEQRKAISQQVEALEASRQEQATLLAQLESTQHELEKAVTMRDDFMSVVAHELRTPLNTMTLQTQLRRMKLHDSASGHVAKEELEEWLDDNERLIDNIVRLIDDMLDVSRIRTGKLSLRPGQVELTALVQRVLKAFEQQFEAAGCELVVEFGAPVHGLWDAFRLEQILVNLISNALRYGARKPIFVGVSSAETGAELIVRDQGVGIAAEHHAAIFRPFERASSDKAITGLGLGLFICEQITIAHGGSIELESEPGRGAQFRVRLPIAERPAGENESAVHRTSARPSASDNVQGSGATL